jgi:hypothetical protein
VAAAHGASAAEVALAWLLNLSPAVVAIPGARRPDTARSAARAATLELDEVSRAAVAREFARVRPVASPTPEAADDREVLLVIGIPAAGKTQLAFEYVARGYVRLNRDERGGSLRGLAGELDDLLSSGTRRVVLDNTYLTRAARSYVIEAAAAHGVATRCVWLDIPLAQAQVNLVERLLELHGALPSPEALRRLAKAEPGVMAPTSQMRALRELEPPVLEEGFATVERLAFARQPPAGRTRAGVFVAAAALGQPGWERMLAPGYAAAPHLLFDWRPDRPAAELDELADHLSSVVQGPVQRALCPHAGGPPRCWCRPPLPGLPLAFARAHGVDPSQSVLVGVAAAHRTLATTLGARYTPA